MRFTNPARRRLLGFFQRVGCIFTGCNDGCDNCPTMDQFNALNSSVIELRDKQIQ